MMSKLRDLLHHLSWILRICITIIAMVKVWQLVACHNRPPRHIFLYISNSNVLMKMYHENRTSKNIFQCKFEINCYFMEDVKALSDTIDILTWRKVNSTKYSVFFQVTRDLLTIHITTVVSEATFRISVCVLDAYPNSLALSIVEALICTQN